MGNKSSKPKPTARPTAPRTLPRFFTARDPAFAGFEIVNLDHVVGAVFTVNRNGYPTIEILTTDQDREQTPTGMGIGSYSGTVACDVAAHLVLVGVDVEGAAEALHRARPGMFEQLHAARSQSVERDAKDAEYRAALRDRAEHANVEHVEEVAGMTKGELWRLVDTCEVHRGFLRHGVKPGTVPCHAGHDLGEPFCAICPYLPVAAPSRKG